MNIIMEVLDVANPNTLIALAYIRVEKNPLCVFCNYICYCMKNIDKKYIAPLEILEAVKKEFGINMSTHMLRECVRILKKSHRITFENATYSLINVGFDIDKYEAEKIQLKEREQSLLTNLVAFVAEYKQIWTIDQAKDYLGNYLLRDGTAINLFTNGSAQVLSQSKTIAPSWYIQKFIAKMQEEKNVSFDYLLQIVKGLMIYIGVYETSYSNQETGQKFRGTKFFIDTRLVLRALGYSSEFEVKSVNELLNLICQEYNGVIAVFEHTVKEVELALTAAAQCLKCGKEIQNQEMRWFANEKNYTVEDFDICSANVRTNLKRLGFQCVDSKIEWNNRNTQKNNIDDNSLFQFIKAKHEHWNKTAIQNDVDSINKVNMLRHSDYSVAFGGKNRLPIFITSNIALITCLREYIAAQQGDDGKLPNWSPNRLPIISDSLLMCRLWLPKANQYANLPALTLARDAYAAQQGNTAFYDKLAKEIAIVREKHSVNLIDIDDARRQKIEQIIVAKSQGDIDSIDDEMVVYSYDELLKMEQYADKQEIRRLSIDNAHAQETLIRQQEAHSNSIAKRFIDGMSLCNLQLLFAKRVWLIIIIVIVAIPQAIAYIIEPQFNGTKLAFITLIISILFGVVDKCIERMQLIDKLQCFWVKRIIEKKVEKIQKNLTAEEKKMERVVIENVLRTLPSLAWFRDRHAMAFNACIQKHCQSTFTEKSSGLSV